MRTLRKFTTDKHMPTAEFRSILKTIGYVGVLRAAADLADGKLPKSERFEDAKDWKVAIGRKIFAHKLLISLTAEKLGCEGPWNPDTFGGYNDTICKKWFRDKLKFKIIK